MGLKGKYFEGVCIGKNAAALTVNIFGCIFRLQKQYKHKVKSRNQ
jgi:hypothetical protein